MCKLKNLFMISFIFTCSISTLNYVQIDKLIFYSLKSIVIGVLTNFLKTAYFRDIPYRLADVPFTKI
jgi:hypothetical protein